ncbi:hypothetical protein L7F22_026963 [Adiantum nelumboides]|nr:hypothetical protein [Adiantum nelumboides]
MDNQRMELHYGQLTLVKLMILISKKAVAVPVTLVEVSPSEQMYEDCSNDEVDSNPIVEVRIDKEAEAMAKRKSGMPNWLLPNDQEVEEWNLGSKEDPKMIKINKHLKKELKDKAWNLFLKFKDVFAWERTDPKGVHPKVCQHKIPLKPNARPIRLRRYRMNPNYAKMVKEENDNLLKARFITEVASSDWLVPIVVVPKKNGKLRVYVDYGKLNAQTIKDPFPLPFTDMMLDEMAGHEMYSFMDGYSGYNQLKIAPDDREKTTFITEWGAFMYLEMPFGLCNALATFDCSYVLIWKTRQRPSPNESLVSHLGDLDNKSEDDENEEDDDDKEDEDNEDPAGTLGHQGLDDDDNIDDANFLGTGPSSGGASNELPPAPQPEPPVSTGTDLEQNHDTGTARGSRDQTIVALMTYKKHNTITIPSTIGNEMATSTAMVSSAKGKEMAHQYC